MQGYTLIDVSEIPLQNKNEFDIDLQLRFANSNKHYEVSEEVKEALIRYLKSPAPKGPFNCISFIEKLLGVEGDFINGLSSQRWVYSEFKEENDIALGDVVLLYAEDELYHPRHTAIKFSDELFLSKAGPDAQFLLLDNLAAMKNLWQAEKILILKRRVA